MYLDQVNYELNKKINDFVCNSNDVPTPEERIDILKQARSFYLNQQLNSLNLLRQSPVVFQKIIKN